MFSKLLFILNLNWLKIKDNLFCLYETYVPVFLKSYILINCLKALQVGSVEGVQV